jgi:hypothetical protein
MYTEKPRERLLTAVELDRLVAPQRFQRHTSLELTPKPPSHRLVVSLRYTVEYTLAPCPIFQDQLTDFIH